MGTPPYMPPEQMMGERVDVRCDLFSLGVVFYQALTNRLPYPEPDRLVMVCEANEARASCATVSPPNALDLAKESRTVSRIGLARSWTVAMEIGGESQGVGGGLATPDFFQVMETAPALGRLFQPEDQAGVGSPVALASHRFWRTAFGGDSTIVGRSVAIDGVFEQSVTLLDGSVSP